MVAYSFQSRFAEPILAGTKRLTIRAARKRHARPGEEVQLFTGMRTRQCRLLGRSTCIQVCPIKLHMAENIVAVEGALDFPEVPGEARFEGSGLDIFARMDGFADWADMRAWWTEGGAERTTFAMTLIRWGALS